MRHQHLVQLFAAVGEALLAGAIELVARQAGRHTTPDIEAKQLEQALPQRRQAPNQQQQAQARANPALQFTAAVHQAGHLQQAVQAGQAPQRTAQGNQAAFNTKRVSNPQGLGTIVIGHRGFLTLNTIDRQPVASPTNAGWRLT